MANLDDAILLAVQAHQRQKDKNGAPYILHPLRVMFRMETEVEMMAAVLHDVVEDTPYSLQNLESAGYPAEVVEAVDALTRRENESYEAFVERAEKNPIARRIKKADLEDNMNLTRLGEFNERDVQRLEKYWRAWRKLMGLNPAGSDQVLPGEQPEAPGPP